MNIIYQTPWCEGIKLYPKRWPSDRIVLPCRDLLSPLRSEPNSSEPATESDLKKFFFFWWRFRGDFHSSKQTTSSFDDLLTLLFFPFTMNGVEPKHDSNINRWVSMCADGMSSALITNKYMIHEIHFVFMTPWHNEEKSPHKASTPFDTHIKRYFKIRDKECGSYPRMRRG